MIFGAVDEPMPEVDISEQRLAQVLVDIKRNSRNRRIAMFAPLVLAAAVVGAMIAAPPQHGGLALTADAETPDPELPRVFGSNGVWRLAEPIEDGPVLDQGPASVIEVPTDPTAPDFTLSPPDQDDLSSLPTSTSSPPTSTSGQSLVDSAPVDPAPADPALADAGQTDLSSFGADIRIEPAITEEDATTEASASDEVTEPAVAPVAGDTGDTGDADTDTEATETDPAGEPAAPESSTPEDNEAPDDVTVAAVPQTETRDPAPANPSTPPAESTDAETQAFSTPATITPQSVLVYNSAHVLVTVQVVDDDSSVIDWCNTRVDWGDGSVTRVAGADDAALCTASCEHNATSSAAGEFLGISEQMQFEHEYTATIDAAPRIFVATGDGCSYTLAELQLPPFTVVPLP